MQDHKQKSSLFWGILLIILGILFLLDQFYYIDFGDFVSTFWPLILIIIGIKIILDKKKKENPDYESSEKKFSTADKIYSSDKDQFTESNVFGELQINLSSKSFSGGTVSNVFGDIHIDLSNVQSTKNICRLSVTGVFGDIVIKTPKDIALRVRSNVVAGNVLVKGDKRDGFLAKMDYMDDNYDSADKKIYIQSSVVFGTISIF